MIQSFLLYSRLKSIIVKPTTKPYFDIIKMDSTSARGPNSQFVFFFPTETPGVSPSTMKQVMPL